MSAPTLDQGADGVPVGRAMLLAAGVAVVLALAVSASVYLSMLNHGHSFARMFGWQLGNWGYWALLAPLVLKAGERLGAGQAGAAGPGSLDTGRAGAHGAARDRGRGVHRDGAAVLSARDSDRSSAL